MASLQMQRKKYPLLGLAVTLLLGLAWRVCIRNRNPGELFHADLHHLQSKQWLLHTGNSTGELRVLTQLCVQLLSTPSGSTLEKRKLLLKSLQDARSKLGAKNTVVNSSSSTIPQLTDRIALQLVAMHKGYPMQCRCALPMGPCGQHAICLSVPAGAINAHAMQQQCSMHVCMPTALVLLPASRNDATLPVELPEGTRYLVANNLHNSAALMPHYVFTMLQVRMHPRGMPMKTHASQHARLRAACSSQLLHLPLCTAMHSS
jgi:hypothetical protein